MLTNADITLYNKVVDRDDGVSRWVRTVIRGVNWQDRQRVTVDDKGLKSADSTKVYIPLTADFGDKNYVDPKRFQLLDAGGDIYTFANGDVVVRGVVHDEIGRTKADNLAHLMATHEAMTIVAVADRRYGSPAMHHFELEVV